MKIGTQDAARYIEFGEAYISPYGSSYAVFVKSRYASDAVLAGLYEDKARAKGVLYEIGLAHEKKTRIFYMPAA